MLEFIETLVTTSSLFFVIHHLAEMTLTDLMVVFLLSKPLFMIIALCAVYGGRNGGKTHYLHHRDCDRFLSNSFSTCTVSDNSDA